MYININIPCIKYTYTFRYININTFIYLLDAFTKDNEKGLEFTRYTKYFNLFFQSLLELNRFGEKF